MNYIELPKSDNLSDFGSKLRDIERTCIGSDSAELAQSRNAVIGALHVFKRSRMEFGRILRAYKLHFKAERGWTKAVSVIADGLACDQRTVERIIDDYERASQLPQVVLEAMAGQKIDPAAGKNAPVVETMLRMPQPMTPEEAKAQVEAAVKENVERKREKAKRAGRRCRVGIDEFAEQIVRQFERQYRSSSPQQRDSEIRYVFELIASRLGADLRELRHSLPAQVPRPETQVAA